jgi:hypothetical protein
MRSNTLFYVIPALVAGIKRKASAGACGWLMPGTPACAGAGKSGHDKEGWPLAAA